MTVSDSETESASGRAGADTADRLVGEVIPQSVEWERLVRRYPVPALALVGVAGFVIGRSHGPAILGALTGAAAARMRQSVEELLDEDAV
jgi:hypothetical protein